MKKDLWNELAGRVRDSETDDLPESAAAMPAMPFGFEQPILRRLARLRKYPPNPFESWASVLRPAVGLAFATAMLCLLLEYRAEQTMPNDALSQTEALFQMAILNEPGQ
jgi:hypothetical protein